mmetsp:Transcript_121236/g.348318  ORF Transcript_121236/g.348318 Transcript_121236/m.348318 type:complete len:232 (+) Transcript_121236:1503-2198(+)
MNEGVGPLHVHAMARGRRVAATADFVVVGGIQTVQLRGVHQIQAVGDSQAARGCRDLAPLREVEARRPTVHSLRDVRDIRRTALRALVQGVHTRRRIDCKDRPPFLVAHACRHVVRPEHRAALVHGDNSARRAQRAAAREVVHLELDQAATDLAALVRVPNRRGLRPEAKGGVAIQRGLQAAGAVGGRGLAVPAAHMLGEVATEVSVGVEILRILAPVELDAPLVTGQDRG